jgi:hypothetical protein
LSKLLSQRDYIAVFGLSVDRLVMVMVVVVVVGGAGSRSGAKVAPRAAS